ncbi:MAG: hypothetical protein RRB13_11870 [bacterium]|nr:hypothetical protein [bacterium]
MNAEVLRTLVKRAFPGLGGWHTIREAKVLAVYAATGTDTAIRPLMVADLQPLDADGKRDESFKHPLAKVALATTHPGIVALPEPGDVALVQFVGWRADKAIVTGYRYRGRNLDLQTGAIQIQGRSGIELGSAEDYLVLHDKLLVALKVITGLLVSICQSGGNLGTPLAALSEVKQATEKLETDWDNGVIRSEIKLGKQSKP